MGYRNSLLIFQNGLTFTIFFFSKMGNGTWYFFKKEQSALPLILKKILMGFSAITFF